jgi:hypothetical protein
LSIPFGGGDFDGDDELDVFEDVDDGDDDIDDDDDDDDDNQISHRDLIVNSLGNVSFKYSRIFF